MRKRLAQGLLASILALTALLMTTTAAFAHPDRTTHNKELERVLFDDEDFSSKHKKDDEGQAIIAIETAAYLCIDQFGSNGSKDLESLRSRVPGLPDSVAELNPTKFNLSPRTHRSYSHRGWEARYYPTKENQERFATRRNILLSTVNSEFGFGWWRSWTKTYTDKCDSFCALVYYTHVMGDYLEDGTDYKKFNGSSNGSKISFATPNPGDTNPDIFWELDKHLAILFKDTDNKRTYSGLMSDINALANRARKLAGTTGGINTDEKCEEAAEYVKELMAILCGGYGGYDKANRIHMLLVQEDFFKETFLSA